jgi:hypothetical protein
MSVHRIVKSRDKSGPTLVTAEFRSGMTSLTLARVRFASGILAQRATPTARAADRSVRSTRASLHASIFCAGSPQRQKAATLVMLGGALRLASLAQGRLQAEVLSFPVSVLPGSCCRRTSPLLAKCARNGAPGANLRRESPRISFATANPCHPEAPSFGAEGFYATSRRHRCCQRVHRSFGLQRGRASG